MGVFSLVGSLGMGTLLVVGQWFFPDFTFMWFASNDASAVLLREIILLGLIASAIVKAYYDNWLLRLSWAVSGGLLVWFGVFHFLDHPSYMLDSLFMLSAGVYSLQLSLQRVPAEVTHLPRVATALQRIQASQTTGHQRQIKTRMAVRMGAGAWARLLTVFVRTTLRVAALPVTMHQDLQDSSHTLKIKKPTLKNSFT